MTVITHVNLGRAITDAELNNVMDYLSNAVAENHIYAPAEQGNFPAMALSVDGQTAIAIWDTADSANAYIAFVNEASPPPVLAQVQII